jgi:hypothetical protein
MREIAHTIALTLPTTHLSYFDVPFKALRNCLPDGHVDLLWTNSSVRHTEVDTFALPLTTERIGIVGAGHMLADAAEITVEDSLAAAPVTEASSHEHVLGPAPPRKTPTFHGETHSSARSANLVESGTCEHFVSALAGTDVTDHAHELQRLAPKHDLWRDQDVMAHG